MDLLRKQRKKFAVLHVIVLVGSVVFSGAGCRSLRQAGPDNRTVRARQLSLRGADLLRRTRYDDAQTLFSQAIDQCPTDERAQWGFATTLWQDGQHQVAVEHMKEAVRLSGNNPEFTVQLGQMYLALDNIPQARLQAETTLQSHRDRADAWALMGDVQTRQADYANALESYHRALLIQSDYPSVQLSVADLYRQLGRPSRSLATLDRMVDMHPSDYDHGEAQLVRALALIDLEREDEAVVALKAAGNGLPSGNLNRQVQLITAQYKTGEIVEARVSLGKLLQSHPHDPVANQLKFQLDNSFEYIAKQNSEGTTIRR